MAHASSHDADVSVVTFTGDCEFLISGDWLGNVKTWRVKNLSLEPEILKNKATRESGLVLEGVKVLPKSIREKELDVLIVKSREFILYERAINGFRKSIDCKIKTITIEKKNKNYIFDWIMKARELNPKVIMTVGLPAAKVYIKNIDDIPVVFCMAMHQEKYGLKKDNTTGVELEPTQSSQLRAFKIALPDLKRIGIIYDEKRTGNIARKAKESEKEADVEVVLKRVKERTEVENATSELIEKVDAIWVTRDATVLTREHFNRLIEIEKEKDIAIIAYSKEFLKTGALLTYSSKYEDQGKAAAEIVNNIISGKNPKDIPIRYPKGKIWINLGAAKEAGTKISKKVLRRKNVEIVTGR